MKSLPKTILGNIKRPDVLIRAFADVLIIGISLFVGVSAQIAFISLVQNKRPPVDTLYSTLPTSIIVTATMGIIIYSLFGLYTRTRGYRGQYKAWVILNAVSLTFLAVGCFAYLDPELPLAKRTTLVFSWVVALTITLLARLFSLLWLRWGVGIPDSHGSVYVVKERPKRVLVIGGAGYIGSALLPKLLARGYHVRLLDAFIYGKEPISSIATHPLLEIIDADFRQINRVVEAMQDVDAVVHLGAIVGDPACALNEELTIEVNLTATRTIAEVAKGRGIGRFIFASTCSVYGVSDGLLNELSSLNPVSLYARSKIASEKVLHNLADDTFAPTILRFGTIYGLSGRTRFDLVVNILAAKAVQDGEITVFGNDQWRPFVHVDDAAQAILLSVEAPMSVVGSEVLNVGSNEQNKTLGEIGDIVKAMVPSAELISQPSGPDRRNYRVDFSKISNRLKFAPSWTVEDGVKQVIDALRSGQVTDYKDSRYSNVKFLSEESGAFSFGLISDWAHALIDSEPNEAPTLVQSR